MKRFLRNNSLSLVLFGLFAVTLVGLSLAGWDAYNSEQIVHDEPSLTFLNYLTTGTFVEAVFENWESEFLQMGAFVLLTIWFRQKGSKDSKKLVGADNADVPPRYSLLITTQPLAAQTACLPRDVAG